MNLGHASTIGFSQFTGNQATTTGGAVHVSVGVTTLVVNNSTFNNNSATTNGGAIASASSVATNSIVINQSTFFKNTASGTSGGGAIAQTGVASVTINNSTINDNTATGATSGGGGGVVRTSTGTFNTYSSIIAGNKLTGGGAGVDIFSSSATTLGLSTSKYNLIGNNTGSNVSFADTTTNNVSTVGLDPLLGQLDDYGGQFLLLDGSHVLTMPLDKLSPAVDKGDANGNANDQRGVGFARVKNGGIALQADVGAYEGFNTLPVASLTTANSVNSAGMSDHTFSITYTDDTGFDTTSFTNGDVLVTGTGYGAGTNATTISINNSGAPLTYVVTYTIPAPAGGWGGPNVGNYSVAVVGTQVSDDTGAFVSGKQLGTFKTNFATSLLVDEQTDADDSNYGTNQLSLREALKISNANTGFSNTITFNASKFNGTTINVGSTMIISTPVSITGPGKSLAKYSGQDLVQLFNITTASATLVSISSMTLTKGRTATDGGAIAMTTQNVTLTNMDITSSSATSEGGAIYMTTGTITIDSVIFDGNTASAGGGHFHMTGKGSASVTNSVFKNGKGTTGGAYDAGVGSHTLAFNRFDKNTGSTGGAINGSSSATTAIDIKNSTFTNNSSSGNGGTLYMTGAGLLIVANSTLANNTAATSGGAPLLEHFRDPHVPPVHREQ